MSRSISLAMQWFLHLDQSLGAVIASQGQWTYGLLALVIFLETGLVVTPFLPGDSLLFAAGAFAGIGTLSLWGVLPLLMIAAIIGDTLNYWVGRTFGLRAYRRFQGRLLKPEYLDRTQVFYRVHGARMIVLARFVPIIRTLAPFVAGVGKMPYGTFIRYNIVGGIAWVGLLTLAGFFMGSIPFVQQHFSVIVLAIVAISLVPLVWEHIVARRKPSAELQ